MNLEQRIEELEKRIAVLESQRPIINVYPYQQPVQPYHPYHNPATGGTLTTGGPTTGGGCGVSPNEVAYSMR